MALKSYKVNDEWIDLDKHNLFEMYVEDGDPLAVLWNGEALSPGGGGDTITWIIPEQTLVSEYNNVYDATVIIPSFTGLTAEQLNALYNAKVQTVGVINGYEVRGYMGVWGDDPVSYKFPVPFIIDDYPEVSSNEFIIIEADADEAVYYTYDSGETLTVKVGYIAIA